MLSIATLGSSFFFLPGLAKNLGIGTILCMLIFGASISYISSIILFKGYTETKEKTYTACVERILGQ